MFEVNNLIWYIVKLQKGEKKMKKKNLLGMLAVVGTMMLVACGSSTDTDTVTNVVEEVETTEETVETEEQEDIEQVEELELTELIMGFDANFPPYGYQDVSGEYVGFDIDLAQEVCDRLGITLVKQPIDWNSKDMELESGAIDCIWNGFTLSEARADAYTWSVPYVDNSQVFVVSMDSGITTIADLTDMVVVVQAGSSALEALSTEEGNELVATFQELMEVPDYNNAFMQLESGVADAVALDIGVANYQLSTRDGAFIMMEEPLSTEVYAIGFLLGNTQLKDMVEGQLMEMVEDGTFMDIATTWGLQDSVTLGR